ncbi:MAG: hypothetical protein JO033_21975 [Acidobacteriaceae bacterium]|nr:hypothetical protein [Acidobacteriaceae bacterium]
MKAALGGGHGALNESEEAHCFGIGERAGFEMARAAQTPELLGELVDQDGFSFIGGLMFSAEIGAKGVELGGIFTGKNKLL